MLSQNRFGLSDSPDLEKSCCLCRLCVCRFLNKLLLQKKRISYMRMHVCSEDALAKTCDAHAPRAEFQAVTG